MRLRIVGTLGIELLLGLTVLSGQVQLAQRDTTEVSGRIVAAETGAPLRRALVRITSSEKRVEKSMTTEADGQYRFANLPAGRYLITATRDGYVSLQFGQRRPFERGKELELKEGQAVESIDFSLSRGGVIVGRITDETGEPLPGVGVNAMRYQFQSNGERRLTIAELLGLRTDDLGQFRLYGLMPGSYVVVANGRFLAGNFLNIISRGNGVGLADKKGYGTAYFPGTTSEADAEPVTVNVGQETPASFVLPAAQLFGISGTVRNSHGEARGGTNLSLRSISATAMTAYNVAADLDGTFRFENLAAGDYVVEVHAAEVASMPLTLSDRDVTDIVVVTAPAATITGRVIFDANRSTPGEKATLRVVYKGIGSQSNTTLNTNGVVQLVLSPTSSVDAAGRFHLSGIIGRGVLDVIGHDSVTKSIIINGANVTDLPMNIEPGARIDGVTVRLASYLTTVTGLSILPDRKPVTDYIAVFLPANIRAEAITRGIRTVRPDQAGRYSLNGLPPGQYVGAAVKFLDDGDQFDPAFQSRIRPRATSFQLHEGDTLSIDLPFLE